MDQIYLYGPPGSGKSVVGRRVAAGLDLAFVDLDDLIVAEAGCTIPEIFAAEGEAGFRARELAALREAADAGPQVIALGGGALLQGAARETAEHSGRVLCLEAHPDVLLARVNAGNARIRPLLAENVAEKLAGLLSARAGHYASFPLRLDTSDMSVDEVAWHARVKLGRFRVGGMGKAYDVIVRPGWLGQLGRLMAGRGLAGPVVVVCDENVAPLYAARALESLAVAGYQADTVVIPAGEAHKTVATIGSIWDGLVRARLERGSTVVALGGGVVGDMTGFAAATFLRGINWVNVPTTLLAMVDSSLGGKTGFDLPQGKNLVGAFYPPCLVLADPHVLQTLPALELRSGLAETVKHGIIADADLFNLCARGMDAVTADLDAVARQGMAVKVKVIEVDPYEKGVRQALNLGHTVGHGVELASAFRLSHGEAVAIGTVVEAKIARRLGLAEDGLAQTISGVLESLGLPVKVPPELDPARIIAAMQMDKKRAAGKVTFALPERIGAVRVGVEVPGWQEIIFEK